MIRIAALGSLLCLTIGIGQSAWARSEYDCAVALAAQPSMTLSHYRGGATFAYEVYKSRSGALLCLKQTMPELRWLGESDAEAAIAALKPKAGASLLPAAGQNSVTASFDLRLARPKPLPKFTASNARPSPTDAAIPAAAAHDDDHEFRPQALMQAQAVEQASSSDTRVQVLNTTVFPYSTVAFIAATYPSGNVFSCTATLVTPYVALTAGHCVYDPSEGGYASRIRVSPGLQQLPAFTGPETFPYGNRLADSFQTTQQWQNEPSGDSHPNGDFVYDVAALFFNAPFPSFTSGAQFLPLAFNNSPSVVTNDGYPGTVQGQSNNQAQWTDTESVISSGDPNLDLNLLTTNIYSSPGDSGSPFWTPFMSELVMVGSLSAGPGNGPGAIGPKYGALVQTLISNWVETTPPNQPESGWWWNANSPGRGFAMETSTTTGNVFFAAFQYDIAGSGIDQWTVATLRNTGQAGQFSGALMLYKNGTALQSLGTVTLNLTNPVQGVLTWPASVGGGSTSIVRFPLDPSSGGQLFAPNYGYSAQRGWWWDPTHPGLGYMIEIQNSELFFGAFTYHADGTASWLSSLNQMTSTTSYSGNLSEYHGGPIYGQTGGSPTSTNAGSVSIQFNSNNTMGTLTLNGQTINIQRFTSF